MISVSIVECWELSAKHPETFISSFSISRQIFQSVFRWYIMLLLIASSSVCCLHCCFNVKVKSLTIKHLEQLVWTILNTAFENIYKIYKSQGDVILLVFSFLYKIFQKHKQVSHCHLFVSPYTFSMNAIYNR